jgi:hypothetical protein
VTYAIDRATWKTTDGAEIFGMTRRLWLVVLTVGAVAGCNDSPPVAVKLQWRFGSGLLCDAAGVASVHVFVGPLAPTGSYDHVISCANGETGVRLEGVAPGPHTIVLKGIPHDVPGQPSALRYELTADVNITAADEDLGVMTLPPYQPPAAP